MEIFKDETAILCFRHQYYNLATQGSRDDHIPLTPEDIQLVGTPGDESLRIITPLSPGDDSLRMLTTPLSHIKPEEEEEVQTKQQVCPNISQTRQP